MQNNGKRKNMIYLWRIPENYKNRDIGSYQYDVSPDIFLLSIGKKRLPDEFGPPPIVGFKISKNKVLKFDCLPNSGSAPLVNERIKNILETIAPNDVQFFPAKLICSDGELNGYYFLNVTHTIHGIDHEQSIYTKMKTYDGIGAIDYLTYKPNCMGTHDLARDEEYKVNLLVTEKIKSIFEQEGITGVWFVRPEDYYRPLTAEDLLNEEAQLLREDQEDAED